MVYAYVMIKTGTGASEGLIDDLRDLSEVVEAHIVAGEYDIITEMDVEDVYTILHVAVSKMQGMSGVVDTRTYISLD